MHDEADRDVGLRDGSLESRVGPRLPPLNQMLAADGG